MLCAIHPIVRKKNSDEEANIQFKLTPTLQEKEKEYDEVLSKWKNKLLDVKENLGDERDKWQSKLYTINEKLERVITRIHRGKQITRYIIHKHIDELAAQES